MYQEDEVLKEIVVIYHGNCPDGFTAAWAAWKKFGDKASYIPCQHNEKGYKIAQEIHDSEVYVLDFSFPEKEILELKKNNKSFNLLDHHISAKNKLEHIEGCFFDMNRSGAGIAWDFFHPDEVRPKLVDYIEDRDLWKNSLSFFEEVASYIELVEREFSKWNTLEELMENSLHEIVLKHGQILLKYKEKHVDRACNKSLQVELLGIDAICVNSADWQSEIGGRLAKETSTFVIIWHQTGDGRFRYSLRSVPKGGMDVSEIAAVFGGGGHENAAAFLSDKIEFTIL